jgi:amino acid adenylation domain-containing protein/non-ribosomal peptide synthase protein (TIGR01720 family)
MSRKLGEQNQFTAEVRSKVLTDLSPEQYQRFLKRYGELKRREDTAGTSRILRRKRTSDYAPASFPQQRLWVLEQMGFGGPAYHLETKVRIRGALDITVLEQGLNEIIRRHEILRTNFVVVDGTLMQQIVPERDISLPVFDLSDCDESEREARATEWMSVQRRDFDLARGALLRATIVRLGPEDHLAQLTMHHIVSDGWSLGILMREWAALYTAFGKGYPSPLPEMPIQYADFAEWQREWLRGEVLEEHLSYWREHLAELPLIQLPTDRTRPPVQSFQGAKEIIALPAQVSDRLQQLSRKEGCTFFMTLLTGFASLLYRYTGQADLAIGTTPANRRRAELESLIGFFANTLVLRVSIADNPSFREQLRHVHEVCLGAYMHQDVPFEMLVEELHPQRDLSVNPLFQVMFVLQNVPQPTFQLPNLSFSTLDADVRAVRFDLECHLVETPEEITASFVYNTDLFEPATIKRMLNHYQRLLQIITDNADQRIGDALLLSPTECQQIVVEWNATNSTYDDQQCLHHLFEYQARIRPDATAVICEEQQLSYQGVNRKANQIARHLRALGLKAGMLVAVYMDRSSEVIPALMGVLKAGGTYVPLEAYYPIARVQWILSFLEVEYLLTDRHRIGIIHDLATQMHSLKYVICLDSLSESDLQWSVSSHPYSVSEVSRQETENLSVDVFADGLAYIIFTSGSTGTPKGVMIQHRPAVNLIDWVNRTFHIKAEDRILFLTSLCFDLSVYDIFGVLAAGGSIRVVGEHDLRHPARLLELLDNEPITLWDSAPAALDQLSPFFGDRAASTAPGNLRLVLLSGDWIPVTLPDMVKARFQGAEVIALGGATEATIWSNYCRVDSVASHWVSIPYGKPIQNARYYILDTRLNNCPIGVRGFLYIGGECLACGYANEPQLTAEKFLPDHFRAEPGARIYRTGDLARYWADGTIEFLGRRDEQVKIRGFRIELGEIESVLRQHMDVLECVVVAQEMKGDKRLVAYVVVREEESARPSILRRHLQERLPEYMIPAQWVILEKLPLTPNGKVDRRALPKPDAARPDLEAVYLAPRDIVEQKLATIWAEILQLERVGVHDNFFELGGDSILSIQVVARANQSGLRLTPRQLFEYQTIADLSRMARQAVQPTTYQGIVEGLVEVTPIQQWFFEQKLADLNHFNQSVLLEGQVGIQVSYLAKAIRVLQEHHDALRLRFSRESGNWKQFNEGIDAVVACIFVDLSALNIEQQRDALATAAEQLQRSLDLKQGPLLRSAWMERGQGQTGRLLLVIHHLAIDGVSWRILLEDLQLAYEMQERGQTLELPAKTSSYQQWAAALREHAQSSSVKEEAGYWLEIVEGTTGSIPLDWEDGVNTEDSARTVTVMLEQEQTDALLHQVPEAYHTQIQEVLLTSLGQVLTEWKGSRAVRVNVEGHGREEIAEGLELERTVGWFTTWYPVRLEVIPEEYPGEALRRTKEQVRRIPRHGIGYGLLQYLYKDDILRKQVTAAGNAEMSFNYLGQFDQIWRGTGPLAIASESTGAWRCPQSQRTAVLEVNGLVTKGRLRLDWTYSNKLHRRETIEQLAATFLMQLKKLIAHCLSTESGSYTPSDFPLAKLDQQRLDRVAALVKKLPVPIQPVPHK